MTVEDFSEILKRAIKDIPDIDGDPGLFADASYYIGRQDELEVEILDADNDSRGEKFKISITKLQGSADGARANST